MKKKLTITVKPNKSQIKIVQTGFDIFGNEVYEVHLTKSPVDNACNNQLIEILSKYFKIAGRNVQIINGKKSRTKIIEILVNPD